MREIDRTVTRIGQRNGTYVLNVLFILVVANGVSFAVRINDVPVARVRHDETALTVAGLEPILPPDHPGAGAAGAADKRVVLLRAINVVRERVIERSEERR